MATLKLLTYLFILLSLTINQGETKRVRDAKYYDLLGVDPDADDRTIQKAYRRAALRYHPDRNPDDPDAESKFREVAEAYEVLSDNEKRRLYDQVGSEGMKQQQQGGSSGNGGFHFQHGDPFNIFENVFGGGMGKGAGGGQRMHFQFNGGGFPGGFQQPRQSESLYSDDALIGELDEDTFPEGDGEGWIWILEFYAPWCGHCRQLAPKWRKVSEALHGVVRVAAVNCEVQKALCQQHEIRGYPSIKAFKEGKLIEYRGDRSAANIKEWALNLLPKQDVTLLSSQDSLETWLDKECAGSNRKARWGACMILFTDKSQTSPLYKSLALRYRGKLSFGEVQSRNKELTALLGVTNFPTLLAVCNGDIQSLVKYTDEVKNTRLTKFLNQFYGGNKCVDSIKINSKTDFSKLKVVQLQQLLDRKGVEYTDCVEKSDFVRKVRTAFNLEAS